MAPSLPCCLAFLTACGSSGDERGTEPDLSAFVLEVIERIELEDTETAPLGEVGVLTVAGNGDLLIGDRLIPRVRRYDRRGRLVAQFGTFGDGPFEFRRVGALVEDEDGRVLVVDPGRSSVTVLSADLVPDTSFRVLPPPLGKVERAGDGYVAMILAARRTMGFAVMDSEWKPVWNSRLHATSLTPETPYWGSYATLRFTASSQGIVATYSFQYPLRLYSLAGDEAGTFGEPPPSYREAPVLQPGALSGPDAAERTNRWFASFTVIANLSVVSDTLLAVTHGRLQQQGSTRRIFREHHSVDFYHLGTRAKIAEDVPLAPDVHVLVGGHRGLYAMSAEPPDPWTISVLELRPLE